MLGQLWQLRVSPELSGTLSQFEIYAKAASSLGDTYIDVYRAEMLLNGVGTRRDIAGGIKYLEDLASTGHQDATRYLIALFRDGRIKGLGRNLAKARSYLDRFGSSLSVDERRQQAFLIDVAAARTADAFLSILQNSAWSNYLNTTSLQSSLTQVNPNFTAYRLQQALKSLGKYNGPLNGLLTAGMLKALRRSCSDDIAWADCVPIVMNEVAKATQ